MKIFKTLNYAQKKRHQIQDRPEVFTPVLESQQQILLIEFQLCIISLNNILHLYSLYVETDDLQHLKVYKFSQDCLELFFGSIRTHGGHNNNPTVKQFRSVYQKLVIRMN